MQKVGRNDPCPCGSGKKYKKCCEVQATAPKKITAHQIEGEQQRKASHVTSLFKARMSVQLPEQPSEEPPSENS